MNIKQLLVILVVCIMISFTSVYAEELTGRDIIDKSNEMESVNNMQAEIKMTIINKSGQERVRELKTYSMKTGDEVEKSLIQFLNPADIRGTGFLSINNPEGADEQYLYLPALGKERRLSSDERGGSFMGSDFTYEDISPDSNDYTHCLLRSDILDEIDVYIVESIPVSEKIKKELGFTKRISWIRKDNFVLIKAEYHNHNGDIFKRLNVLEVEEVDEGLFMHIHLEMRDLEKGSRTLLKYKQIEINTGLDDSYFSIRHLTRPI